MDDKIPFYALDLRNISRLVKTKTQIGAQCLVVNTGSLKIIELWCYSLNLKKKNKLYVFIYVGISTMFGLIRTAREGRDYSTCLNRVHVEVPRCL